MQNVMCDIFFECQIGILYQDLIRMSVKFQNGLRPINERVFLLRSLAPGSSRTGIPTIVSSAMS